MPASAGLFFTESIVLSVGNHPHVLTSIHVDGRDTIPRRLDERQYLSSASTRALRPTYRHVGRSARTRCRGGRRSQRACPPVRDRRNIEDAGFRIGGGALPVGSTLIVRNRQRPQLTARDGNDWRSEERAHFELRCDAQRFCLDRRV